MGSVLCQMRLFTVRLCAQSLHLRDDETSAQRQEQGLAPA